MSDVIRLASAGPLFRAGGFKLTARWSPVAIADLTKDQIEILRTRIGRWIDVYPSDEAALAELLAKNPPAATPATKAAAKVADSKAVKAAGKEG